MSYYDILAKQMGFYYNVRKWKENFQGFLKFCQNNNVNPYRLIDFLFFAKNKVVMPWLLDKISLEVLNEFKEKFANKLSLIEVIEKEMEDWEKLKEYYKRIGIKEKEHLFLVLKGDVFLMDYYPFSDYIKRFLNKFNIRKKDRFFLTQIFQLVYDKKGGDYAFRHTEKDFEEVLY